MKKNKPNTAAVTVIVCLVLPLLNVLILRGFGLFFLTEPLKYPPLLADAFAFVYDFLRGALAFLPPLCITRSVLDRNKRFTTAVIAVLSVPAVYLVMALEDLIINSQKFDPEALGSAALDIIVVVIGYCIVAVAAFAVSVHAKTAPCKLELFSTRGLFSRGAVVSTLVTAAIITVQQAFETYALVMTYGSPEDASQVMELVTPYITLLIGALLSYIVGSLVIMRQEGSHKSREPRK